MAISTELKLEQVIFNELVVYTLIGNLVCAHRQCRVGPALVISLYAKGSHMLDLCADVAFFKHILQFTTTLKFREILMSILNVGRVSLWRSIISNVVGNLVLTFQN